MRYNINLENGAENYAELEANYRRHYSEMKERLTRDGVSVAEYSPRLDAYFEAFNGGWLLNFVARHEGKPVGHCNVYVTNDMHNGQKIAQEDVLYVVPEHRNGLGRQMVKHVLSHLREIGVKRVSVSAVTDLRVAKIWGRMGFKPIAQQMIYTF